MSRFKVGDLVTPISVKPYSDRIQRRLLGKTLVIYSFQDNGNSFLVFAGVIGDCGFFWHPDDLRLVSETQAEPTDSAHKTRTPKLSDGLVENWGGCGFLNPYAGPSPTEPTDPEPAAAQKPLRRGDLVEYDGRVCVVAEIDPEDGDCWVAALTGEHGYDRVPADELKRIGSIRKKVKRLKAAIAKAGGAV